MFNLPDAAIGAVVAALIAGTVSLLGLIISKEQKTSEFRQTWIDALRLSLVDFLARINAIQDALRVEHGSDAERIQALHPHYVPLNSATFNILLRVNPREPASKRLLECLGTFNRMARTGELQVENIRPVQAEFLMASQELLKSEWKRVKSGEWTFILAKWLAFTVVVASLLGGGWLLFHAVDGARTQPMSSPAKRNAPNQGSLDGLRLSPSLVPEQPASPTQQIKKPSEKSPFEDKSRG